MDTLILIAGFIGAWLLFAGPVYQAVLELHDENIERDRVEAIAKKVRTIPPVSAWWWIVPPVKLILERKRSNTYRRAYFDAMTAEDSAVMISFINKATAWLFVGAGGLLIAAKETYELGEHFHWPVPVFLGVVIVMIIISIFNTGIRVRRSREIIESKHQ